MEFEEKYERVLIAQDEIGQRYADAKSLSWYMQEMRKVILAKEMCNFEGSEVYRERMARKSEAYLIHIEGTKEAIGEELRLKAKYEKLTNQFEAYRSLCSLEKKKINQV